MKKVKVYTGESDEVTIQLQTEPKTDGTFIGRVLRAHGRNRATEVPGLDITISTQYFWCNHPLEKEVYDECAAFVRIEFGIHRLLADNADKAM